MLETQSRWQVVPDTNIREWGTHYKIALEPCGLEPNSQLQDFQARLARIIYPKTYKYQKIKYVGTEPLIFSSKIVFKLILSPQAQLLVTSHTVLNKGRTSSGVSTDDFPLEQII